MRAIVPLLCAYLHLFCPRPPSNTASLPPSSWLNHLAPPQDLSPSLPSPPSSNPPIPPSKPDEFPLTFPNKKAPSDLDKRSVLHFKPPPPCNDNRKRSFLSRLSLKPQSPPPPPNCIPSPIHALLASRNAELNRRAEHDRAGGEGAEQVPMRMAMVDGGEEEEKGRRRSWDREFAGRKEELLRRFGEMWAGYLG